MLAHFFQHCSNGYTEEPNYNGQPELLAAIQQTLLGVWMDTQEEIATVLEELAALLKKNLPALVTTLNADGGDIAMPNEVGAE